MKTIITILVFLSFTFSFAQEHFKFYIEIPNSTIVPEISYRRNGTVSLSFVNNDLNTLFSNYSIYKFERIFPTATTPRLQKLYLIESGNSDLFNNLKTNHTNYFPTIEEQNAVGELLYTPNDWDLNDPVYHHANYDLMNVREAWDYSKGDPDFLIGISDSGINLNHEDLIGKVSALDLATDWHGTSVVGIAAANTDNNIGIPGIGFNSKALFKTYYGTPLQMMNTLLLLSQNGARVVNASWHNGTCTYSADEQLVMNEIYNNGTVIVAAAGNGSTCSNSSNYADTYVYPASYDHVISVSSVGMAEVGYLACCGPYIGENYNWRDRVEIYPGHPEVRHQTNDQVDLRAPGTDVRSLFDPRYNNEGTKYAHIFGTSIAAPQVSGAISLMFTANSCLNPDEVESLLKLTSVKLDSIQENLPYLGKLGAGRMDVGKATKAAWQMNPANGGEVLLKNRTFERWDFELLNSPEYIRLKNEGFIQNTNVKFRAKKGITLDTNTLLAPGSGKSHYLYVENTDTCFYFNKSFNPTEIVGKKANSTELSHSNIKLYPNPSRNFINIHTGDNIQRTDIYDMAGKIVKTSYSVKRMNVEDLPKGSYLVKVQLSNNEVETIKFIKN